MHNSKESEYLNLGVVYLFLIILEQRLTDYYFWGLELLRTKLPSICEGPQKDVGCLETEQGGNSTGDYCPKIGPKNDARKRILEQGDNSSLSLGWVKYFACCPLDSARAGRNLAEMAEQLTNQN